jgi:hypothetical protein
VSKGNFYADTGGEAVYGPGNAVSFVNDANPNVLFTYAPLGGTATTNANLALAGFDATNWTASQAIDQQSENDAALAGGPGGLVLLYERGTPGQEQYVERKFTGSGWSPATPVSEIGGLRVGDLMQDASGRLHAVWINNETHPRWRTSTDGVGWAQTVTINASEDMLPGLHVGAAGDGLGFTVWDSHVGSSGAVSDLRAVPLEPFDFPPQPQQPGESGQAGGGGQTGAGGKAGDACQAPNCIPAGGNPSSSVGNKSFMAEVVIPSCQTKQVNARVRIEKRKVCGKVVVTVKQVVFRLDCGKRKRDKKPPYTKLFSLTGAKPGSLHTLRAKVSLTVKKGRAKAEKRTLKLSKKFRVCPRG